MVEGARLHHIGLVLSKADTAAHQLQELMGFGVPVAWVYDPVQQARIGLAPGGDGSAATTLLEYVEPDEGSRLHSFTQKGNALHHLGYSVPSLSAALSECTEAGHRVVLGPVPAVAFGGGQVAFVYTRARVLVELIEGAPGGEGE